MKTNVLRGLSVSTVTTGIMRYTPHLAIVQFLGVMLFATWALSF